jgi:hypothetical protein
LRGWKIFIFIDLALFCLISIRTNSQGLSLEKWLGKQFLQKILKEKMDAGKIRFRQELDYALSAHSLSLINYLHSQNVNRFGLLQNLRLKILIDNDKNFRFANSIIHNLGFQHYFDSITQVNVDDNTLTTRLDLKITGPLTFTFNSILTSKLLQGYDYMINDSGRQIHVLNSSFLTPLTWTFSLGLGYTLAQTGSLNLGISGGKLTYILNQNIFMIRGLQTYYGIEKGENHLLEYGMSFHLLIDKDLLKFLHWNCDLLLFKNYHSAVDVTIKNLFGLKITKFLGSSISTKILFEEKTSKHLQFENLVSFGFTFHL